MTVQQQVTEFLAQERIAIVGVSRDEKDFTRTIFNEFVKRGYDVVPVNPNAADIAGQKCYARVQEIQPPVGGVLVMTPPAASEQVARDCAAAGVKHVWLHRGEGIGAMSDAALAVCQQNGIGVVPGFCPYMFLDNTAFFHRIHAFFRKRSADYRN